jgi:hypothetical protein
MKAFLQNLVCTWIHGIWIITDAPKNTVEHECRVCKRILYKKTLIPS